jgi:hypothetical protein
LGRCDRSRRLLRNRASLLSCPDAGWSTWSRISPDCPGRESLRLLSSAATRWYLFGSRTRRRRISAQRLAHLVLVALKDDCTTCNGSRVMPSVVGSGWHTRVVGLSHVEPEFVRQAPDPVAWTEFARGPRIPRRPSSPGAHSLGSRVGHMIRVVGVAESE